MLHEQAEADLLWAVTDALLRKDGDVDAVLRRYDVSRREYDGAVRLISRLHITLVGVKPSRRFVTRLKAELLGTPRRGVVGQIRHLPPRVQIAAGMALVIGFMLLARRKLVIDARAAAPAQQPGEATG